MTIDYSVLHNRDDRWSQCDVHTIEVTVDYSVMFIEMTVGYSVFYNSSDVMLLCCCSVAVRRRMDVAVFYTSGATIPEAFRVEYLNLITYGGSASVLSRAGEFSCIMVVKRKWPFGLYL